MISAEQLDAEIRFLEDKQPNYTIMSQLADLYVIRDHMQAQEIESDSVFYGMIKDKDLNSVFLILDELMETLEVLNPSLRDSIIRKFNELK